MAHVGKMPSEVQDALLSSELVRITKSSRRSTVHRRVHMDTIGIRRFDAKGKPVGEFLFVGLLTSSAYNQSPREIPFLRKKVGEVMEISGFDAGSHSGKALMHVLETYPRDELFQIESRRLYEIGMGIVHLQERQRIALFVRPDPFQRYMVALVYVPREKFSSDLRQKLGEVLAKSFGGHVAAYFTFMTDEVLSRVQFIIHTTPGSIPHYNTSVIENRLVDAWRTWGD